MAAPLSPNVIATFLTCFGAGGMIAVWAFGYGVFRSLLVAVPSGFAFAAIFFYALKMLFSVTQASSEAVVADLVGESGMTTVAIAENGTGEIAYHWLGTRYSAPAKAVDSKPIPLGQKVIIDRIENGVYFVHMK
jgi:hypothetical protein